MTEKYKITEAYLFVDEDEKGEGLIALHKVIDGNVFSLPLMACDKDRYNSLLPYALQHIKSGRKVKIIKLSNREELGELEDD